MDLKLNHNNIRNIDRYLDLQLDGIDDAISIRLYYFMKRLRLMEEALAEEYHPADEMRCPVHFCIGQEVAPAIINMVIKEDDFLFCHHRSHGYYLAKNAPMKSMFAELYGKETGSNKGRAGSQDISFSDKNFYSGAILAGAIAIAIGTAISIKMRNTDEIVFVGFGESATDEGIFWESINYAALMSLPIIFICENNNYSVFSPQEKRQSGGTISEKAKIFGVEGKSIFGNDVALAFNELNKFSNKCRVSSKPFLLELYTSRWSAHYGPENDDNVGYRNKEEISFWKNNCPISLLKEKLDERSLIKKEDENKHIISIKNEIEESFKFAKASLFPSFTGWNTMNSSDISPLADKHLIDIESKDYNFDKDLLVPKGY